MSAKICLSFLQQCMKEHFCFFRIWLMSEIHPCCTWAKNNLFHFSRDLNPCCLVMVSACGWSTKEHTQEGIQTGSGLSTPQEVLSILQSYRITMIIFSESFCSNCRSYSTCWRALCFERIFAMGGEIPIMQYNIFV